MCYGNIGVDNMEELKLWLKEINNDDDYEGLRFCRISK